MNSRNRHFNHHPHHQHHWLYQLLVTPHSLDLRRTAAVVLRFCAVTPLDFDPQEEEEEVLRERADATKEDKQQAGMVDDNDVDNGAGDAGVDIDVKGGSEAEPSRGLTPPSSPNPLDRPSRDAAATSSAAASVPAPADILGAKVPLKPLRVAEPSLALLDALCGVLGSSLQQQQQQEQQVQQQQCGVDEEIGGENTESQWDDEYTDLTVSSNFLDYGGYSVQLLGLIRYLAVDAPIAPAPAQASSSTMASTITAAAAAAVVPAGVAFLLYRGAIPWLCSILVFESRRLFNVETSLLSDPLRKPDYFSTYAQPTCSTTATSSNATTSTDGDATNTALVAWAAEMLCALLSACPPHKRIALLTPVRPLLMSTAPPPPLHPHSRSHPHPHPYLLPPKDVVDCTSLVLDTVLESHALLLDLGLGHNEHVASALAQLQRITDVFAASRPSDAAPAAAAAAATATENALPALSATTAATKSTPSTMSVVVGTPLSAPPPPPLPVTALDRQRAFVAASLRVLEKVWALPTHSTSLASTAATFSLRLPPQPSFLSPLLLEGDTSSSSDHQPSCDDDDSTDSTALAQEPHHPLPRPQEAAVMIAGPVSGATASFLIGQVLALVQPPKKVPNFKIQLRRAPTQEEFFRGNLARNPLHFSDLEVKQQDDEDDDNQGANGGGGRAGSASSSSSSASSAAAGEDSSSSSAGGAGGAGGMLSSPSPGGGGFTNTNEGAGGKEASEDEIEEPTMADLRRKIAVDLEMADAAELLELLVAGKIVQPTVKVRLVFAKVTGR
jgi:hypothetical protein